MLSVYCTNAWTLSAIYELFSGIEGVVKTMPDASKDKIKSVLNSHSEQVTRESALEARTAEWLNENAVTFKEQSVWHEQVGHPLAEIMILPAALSWKNGQKSGGPST